MTDTVVVIKPHQDLEIRSKTPLTSEDIFKTNAPELSGGINTYTVLERNSITVKPDPENNRYVIKSQAGLIRKIHLVDFPPGQYFLQIENQNVATAKLENGQYAFHLDAEHRSQLLDYYSNITTLEVSTPDREKYIQIGRVDRICILTPSPLEKEMKIRLEGLFRDRDGNWTHSNALYTLYPNEMYVPFRRMVRRMIITSPKDENIYLRIIGRVYGPILVHAKGQFIEFEGFDIIEGIESKYVPDVKKCIPFSRIGEMGIISSNRIEIVALSYNVYMMDCLPRFAY